MKRNIAIGKLKKLFKEKENLASEKVNEECFTDRSNVVAFIPKTLRTSQLFKGNFEAEKSDTNIADTLDFNGNKAKFSTEYVKKLLELINAFESETVEISVQKDYPLMLETEDFKIVLAPRVD